MNRTAAAKPTETERRSDRNFRGSLWVTDCCPSYNAIYYCKLQTIEHCVRRAEIFPSSLFSYATVWFSTPSSLCFSPPGDVLFLEVSALVVQVGGRNRTDLATAWAAAPILLQMQKTALGKLDWEILIALSVPPDSSLPLKAFSHLTVWCCVTEIASVAA